MADTRSAAGEGSEPRVPNQDQHAQELANLIAQSTPKPRGFWRRRRRKSASDDSGSGNQPLAPAVEETGSGSGPASGDSAVVGAGPGAGDSSAAGDAPSDAAKAADGDGSAEQVSVSAESTDNAEADAADKSADTASATGSGDAEAAAQTGDADSEAQAGSAEDGSAEADSVEDGSGGDGSGAGGQASGESAAVEAGASGAEVASKGADERVRSAVGVVYEPDESPDGFPLEFGNIIVGLPKQPESAGESAVVDAAGDGQAEDGRAAAQADEPAGADATVAADGESVRDAAPVGADEVVADAADDAQVEGVDEELADAESAGAEDGSAESVADSADGSSSADAEAAVAGSAGEGDGSAADEQADEAAGSDGADESVAADGAGEDPGADGAAGNDSAGGAEDEAEAAGDAETSGAADGAEAAGGAVAEGTADASERGEDADAAGEDTGAAADGAVGNDSVGAGEDGADGAGDAADEVEGGAGDAEGQAEGAGAGGAADEAEDVGGGVGRADGAAGVAAGDAGEGSPGDAAVDGSGDESVEVAGDGADGVAAEGAGDGSAGEAADDAGEGVAAEEPGEGAAAGDAEDGGEGESGEELTAEQLAERLVAEQAAMALITALMKLRGVLAGSQLPLEVVGADEARQQQKAMLDQLDDYLLPRLVQLEAPILAVVGGSTGAGKSTLVNTVIGKVVSEPGVLRPTTRSPVLIHHPADADWFVGDRVLPGMARTSSDEPGGMEDAGQLRLVAADSVPRGLAILDAPDIDSVVEANRDLATQLLAAADLWLFVTTAARYSDAVPWEFLQSASDRSTAVAVVLDRAPSETIDDITGHLAQMLLERGLGDSPLFSIQETVVDGNGMLPQSSVASIKDWLVDLAADAEARASVVRRTLQGAVSAMVKKAPPFAAAVRAQAETAVELRTSVESAYDQGVKDIAKACQDGTVLRGEVLARWQEFVGTGELLKGLQSNAGRLRDRLKTSLGNKPAETRDVSDAIQSGLESLLREHAVAAAERAEKVWQATAPGRQLLATSEANRAGAASSAGGSGGSANGAEGNGASLGAMSAEFPAAASRTVREWQTFVLDLVRKEGADKKSTARILEYGVNGLGLSLMVVVFASGTGIPKGAQASAGAGSAVVGRRLLEAVFGDKAVQGMVDRAREDLDGKVHALMDAEFARYLAVLDQHPVDAETARQLTEAARAVEDCT
ncbi:AAA family ATPase [Kribbella speibonae]|uniref:AAA family ATPase n=2 Tax=Kribbella speibonae TaxID=1572660 RepID=A0ABY2AAN1_9ACTN|nr:AAA family ATPase [Kribbella speibonae]